jgi:hypothetical protein
MKLNKIWMLGIVNIIFVIVAIFFATNVINKGNKYTEEMHQHVKVLEFKDRLLNSEEWTLLLSAQIVSQVDDTVWEKKKEESQLHLKNAEQSYSEMKNSGTYLIWLSIALLGITIILYAGGDKMILAMGGSLLSISLVCLVVGVFTPMLEIHAFQEDLEIPIIIKVDEFAAQADSYIDETAEYIETASKLMGYDLNIPEKPLSNIVDGYQYDHVIKFEGRMYYYHQSKSVSSIIKLLLKDGNHVVAWAIISFSIIIPLIKLLLTLLLVYVPSIRRKSGFMTTLSILGKWSMGDVFVVAIFLAYFSFHNMNEGIQTASEALIGAHFFLAYVVISVLSSTLVWIVTKKETKMKGYELIA